VSRGLFELRRDEITGWWVAVVVEREFNLSRFRRAAKPLGQEVGECPNCAAAAAAAGPGGGGGAAVRMLKPDAFVVAGTEREAREAGAAERDPELGMLGDAGSYQTILAPAGHHEPLARTTPQIAFELLVQAREQINLAREAGQTEYLAVVHNWGRQAGALTDHLCFDFYDLPHIPHRIGEELGGAARYVIREGGCPFCRLVRDEPATGSRLVHEDAASVCFAPYASRSPFELWVVPRHHAADFGTATDAQLSSAAETLQRVLARLDVLDGPPLNLILHTAPLRQRVDETYHWHWEIHPRLREMAGLELGTGLPVNPVSPEEAVVELCGTSQSEAGNRHTTRGAPVFGAPAPQGRDDQRNDRSDRAVNPRRVPGGGRD
jgi:UDPglucose--hexose-1-phosphate uridylyltransferase